ncbi:S41 family peptidase [Lacibacter sp.]|uniref:S41 family peptidase n=1 Tax=Lacibacter sp. TaxID=1915409 RepID=UPI002B4AC105|nr:S41 family peptidase [Lacibacter sp.]HLP36868.1 S41 family peptidase [Lacibacter sp.]
MKSVSVMLFFVATMLLGHAQDFNKAMQQAFLITRMVDKFHIQPKPLNDAFSQYLFQQFIATADKDQLIFQADDIATLSVFRNTLDEEILQRKTNFLQTAVAIMKKRVRENDSLVQLICKTPFNFSAPDKIVLKDDSAFAASITAKQQKLYKQVKWQTLDLITDILAEFPERTTQKKLIDSLENVFRKRIQTSSKKKMTAAQVPGRNEEFISNLFCKVLANCYDPHTVFLPEEEKENFDEGVGQTPKRFGFELDEDENGDVVIDRLQPGSSAFKSGAINPGDKIVAIQEPGKQVVQTGTSAMLVVDSVMSEMKADKLLVTVKKPDGTTRVVTLYKERFSTEEDEEDIVQGYVLKGTKNIGYISIPDFYFDWENTNTGINGCANDVAKEIIKLKKENIEGLIIDIRFNGGGSLQEAVDLSGIFIDGGPVAQLKTKEPKPYTLKDVNSGRIFDGPLLVMVNGYSASASETFSATMQDYNRAVIAGTTTYGKSTGQVIFPLDTTVTIETFSKVKADNYLKITTSALYRLTGTTAQQQGVQPDVVLPDLLQSIGEKEKDKTTSFKLTSIEPNKYYKPLATAGKEKLTQVALSATDTSTYFKKVNEYVKWYKSMEQLKEISLKLDDMLLMKKKQQEYILFFEEYQPASVFTVDNHQLRKQRLKASEWLTESDEETKELISTDPYIQICYQLVMQMATK